MLKKRKINSSNSNSCSITSATTDNRATIRSYQPQPSQPSADDNVDLPPMYVILFIGFNHNHNMCLRIIFPKFFVSPF